MSGTFLVLEGLDGAGTTTQLERLVQAIGGVPTFEPSDGPAGRLIREALAQQNPLSERVLPYLFAADRRDHLDRLIAPTVAEGRTVVSDRYVASSLAYQSLTAPVELIWRLNRDFRAPDLTLFVDLPVAICADRVEARARAGGTRDIFETRERLTEIAARYEVALALLAEHGHPIARIDGHGTVEQVHQRVMAAVREVS